MSDVKEMMSINKERYLKLLEDSAILRQIEYLLDQGLTGDAFCTETKDIIKEMKLSRYDTERK